MKAFIVAVLLIVSPVAFAIDSAPAFEDPVQQARYTELISRLRCVTCRGYSIADSNIELASDLRRQVRELMAQSKSDDEIFKYMTDRYGEYILYDPPVVGRTWVLWAAPVLLLVFGVTGAMIVIARKSRLPDTDPADPGLGAS
jgi:cytochrome c-type biogenesis protein CcmH